MKNVLLAVVGSALMGSAALAADLPVKAAPRPIPVHSWTGCYVGAGGGYGFSTQQRQVINNEGPLVFDGDNAELALNSDPGTVLYTDTVGGRGWFGTVQGGCDYQFANSNWVVGVFADGDWSDIKGDYQLFNNVFTGERKLSSSWAVGGRIGWLVTPTLLSFVSGGYTRAH